MKNYVIKPVPTSKWYNSILDIIDDEKDIDKLIATSGVWHSPIKGCFKVSIFKPARLGYYRTIHFRIDAVKGQVPIIHMW